MEKDPENTLVYVCPMHPSVRQSSPGRCPECGMNLVPEKPPKGKLKEGEFDKHKGHTTEMFLRKFWVSLVLTIIVVFYSELPEKALGFVAPPFLGSQYLSVVLASVVFFYGGWVFIIGAFKELRAKLPGMMTLIALAISAAYIYSLVATFSQKGHTLFWELTTLITVMLLGHWLEMKAVSSAQGALKELSKLIPDEAEVIQGEEIKIIPTSELKVGDLVLVKPGARIPADGIVSEGESEVNEAMITGESKLVAKKKESQVIAGTINGDGSLKVKVTKIGEDTFLSGVMRLVAEAQASKSRLQILSDRAAFYLTIIAISTGIVTLILWLFAKAGIGFALERLVAVLVIACPHALGLAVPLVASISTTMAARSGFLIRQRLALEAARSIDMVLFDKTGTLTLGEYGVVKVWSLENNQKKTLELAASVDSHSEHPIAQAIVKEAKKKKITLLSVKNFARIPGIGAKGQVAGKEISIGGTSILNKSVGQLSPVIEKEIAEENKRGRTVIYVLSKGEIIGAIALADIIRSESKEAISVLKKMGLKVAMITGDSEDVANWAGEELSIDQTFARVLPPDKAEKVKILQQKGYKVAMVGDGINDAPALTQSDLGIAIGAGTNVAIQSAGIILVKNDPRDIVKIIKLSRVTYSKMIQNLFWATGYNVIALPMGAGILASKGILLQPALAALFMSLSTIIVAVNAIFLRKTKLI